MSHQYHTPEKDEKKIIENPQYSIMNIIHRKKSLLR